MSTFEPGATRRVMVGLVGLTALGLTFAAACGSSSCEESFSCPPQDSGGQGGEGGGPASCERDNGGCHELAMCTIEKDTVKCSCPEGYDGDGTECADVDECAKDNGGCHEHATCTNTPGSRECACDEGYFGDGIECWPLTELVTVGIDGEEANGDSSRPCFSADGRYLVFTSEASNLVEGDTNGVADVFRYDLESREIVRVSVADDGSEGNGDSTVPHFGTCTISADGRYVAFSSDATNLVAGDTNDVRDVFLRDIQEGTTVRVTVGMGGAEADGESAVSAISADGTRVLFQSSATNLAPQAGNRVTFLRDLSEGRTEAVGLRANGVHITSYRASMDAAGTMFAWDTVSTINENDDATGDARFDILLRSNGVTRIVTHVYGDETMPANGTSRHAVLTPDGLYVVFESGAPNLLPPGMDTNGSIDVYLKNLASNAVERVSLSAISTQVTGDSRYPKISADARFVLFYSESNELVSGDSNGASDVFLRDRQKATTLRVSVGSRGEEADAGTVPESLALTQDGSRAAFGSLSTTLAPGVSGAVQHIYLRHLAAAGETELAE